MIKKFKEALVKFMCKTFGHKVSQVALILAEIKGNDLNRGLPNIMKCGRKGCGWELDLNDPEAIDAYLKKIGKA